MVAEGRSSWGKSFLGRAYPGHCRHPRSAPGSRSLPDPEHTKTF